MFICISLAGSLFTYRDRAYTYPSVCIVVLREDLSYFRGYYLFIHQLPRIALLFRGAHRMLVRHVRRLTAAYGGLDAGASACICIGMRTVVQRRHCSFSNREPSSVSDRVGEPCVAASSDLSVGSTWVQEDVLSCVAHLKQLAKMASSKMAAGDRSSSWETALRYVAKHPSFGISGLTNFASLHLDSSKDVCSSANFLRATMCALEWLFFIGLRDGAPPEVCERVYRVYRLRQSALRMELDKCREPCTTPSVKLLSSPFHPKDLYYHYAVHLLRQAHGCVGEDGSPRCVLPELVAGDASRIVDRALQILLLDAPVDFSTSARRPTALLLVLEGLRWAPHVPCSSDAAVSLPVLSWLQQGESDGSSRIDCIARECLLHVHTAASVPPVVRQEALLLYFCVLARVADTTQLSVYSPLIRKLLQIPLTAGAEDARDSGRATKGATPLPRGQASFLEVCGPTFTERIVQICIAVHDRLHSCHNWLSSSSVHGFLRSLVQPENYRGEMTVLDEWLRMYPTLRNSLLDTLLLPLSVQCQSVRGCDTTGRGDATHLCTIIVFSTLEGLHLSREKACMAKSPASVQSWKEHSSEIVSLLRLLVVALHSRQGGMTVRKKDQYAALQELWFVILRAVDLGYFASPSIGLPQPTSEVVNSCRDVFSVPPSLGSGGSVLEELVFPFYDPSRWRRDTVNVFVSILQQWGMASHLRHVFMVIHKREDKRQQVCALEFQRITSGDDNRLLVDNATSKPSTLLYYRPTLTLSSCEHVLHACCDTLQDPRSAALVIRYMLCTLRIIQHKRRAAELTNIGAKERAPISEDPGEVDIDAKAESVLGAPIMGDSDDVLLRWYPRVQQVLVPKVDALFRSTGLDTESEWMNQ